MTPKKAKNQSNINDSTQHEFNCSSQEFLGETNMTSPLNDVDTSTASDNSKEPFHSNECVYNNNCESKKVYLAISNNFWQISASKESIIKTIEETTSKEPERNITFIEFNDYKDCFSYIHELNNMPHYIPEFTSLPENERN